MNRGWRQQTRKPGTEWGFKLSFTRLEGNEKCQCWPSMRCFPIQMSNGRGWTMKADEGMSWKGKGESIHEAGEKQRNEAGVSE